MRRINGNRISDVLDYKFYTYDSILMLELKEPGGKIKLVRLRKSAGADLGLEFELYLMAREHSCTNKCIFCFIDQLPRGMRSTLYYKDDDLRLSFLQGNYITLSNLTSKDAERIIKMRISPINVSVHSLDPALRAYMLGSLRGAAGINTLKRLAAAGIKLNCQIVCCPGINDGAALKKTLESFVSLGNSIVSVSIVPVGLTKHRQGLTLLRPFDKKLALDTIKLVDAYAKKCLKKRGSRVFFCADELYILAGLDFPAHEAYEDYPQLENGVGMMRLFATEFLDELDKYVPDKKSQKKESCSIVTGAAAGKYLTNLLKIAKEKYDSIEANVLVIDNNFFGRSVTVSGLVTGSDIITQLKSRQLGARLLIPQNMLRRGEEVFLDDVTISQLAGTLGVTVRVIRQDGADLLHALL